jgi:hypothetical protein
MVLLLIYILKQFTVVTIGLAHFPTVITTSMAKDLKTVRTGFMMHGYYIALLIF